MDEIKRKNQEKFSCLRQLNLPIDAYATTGSGPLGIRNLREIKDIDIIVTSELWDNLAAQYGVTQEEEVQKIVSPDGIVEVFREGSFNDKRTDANAPTVADRIAKAEVINGLPFDSIETVLYYKHKSSRHKDLQDILIIKKWLRMQK